MSDADPQGQRELLIRYLLSTGNAFLESGKYAVAKPFFQRAVVMIPRNSVAHHGLGLSLQGEERFAVAARCHYLAGVLDTSSPANPFAAAQCYWQLGRRRLAQRAAHEAKRRLSADSPQPLVTKVLRFCDQLDQVCDGIVVSG